MFLRLFVKIKLNVLMFFIVLKDVLKGPYRLNYRLFLFSSKNVLKYS